MGKAISAPTLNSIRIRDRRRVRRAPRGAICLDAGNVQSFKVRRYFREALWFSRDDARQFAMSFTAFFTAAMIFLA